MYSNSCKESKCLFQNKTECVPYTENYVQVIFIFICFSTVHIVSKQLHRNHDAYNILVPFIITFTKLKLVDNIGYILQQ